MYILIIYYGYKTFIGFVHKKQYQLWIVCFVYYWVLKVRLQNLFYIFEVINISVISFLICILCTH